MCLASTVVLVYIFLLMERGVSLSTIWISSSMKSDPLAHFSVRWSYLRFLFIFSVQTLSIICCQYRLLFSMLHVHSWEGIILIPLKFIPLLWGFWLLVPWLNSFFLQQGHEDNSCTSCLEPCFFLVLLCFTLHFNLYNSPNTELCVWSDVGGKVSLSLSLLIWKAHWSSTTERKCPSPLSGSARLSWTGCPHG